jgi:RNA polymerase sigma-70 factor, ECF subfamily
MRRLGVAECDLDDAMQDVISVLADRLEHIDPDKEKSFVMGTAFRVASGHRRRRNHRRETAEENSQTSSALATL